MTPSTLPVAARPTDNRAALFAMVAAVAAFSLNDTIMKLLGEISPTGQNLVIRAMFATPLAYLVARARGETIALRHMRRPIMVVRAACEMTIVGLFISSLPYLSLGDAITITQTTPLMMTALAAIYLKEVVGWRRWAATAVGFVGVMLVARPGAHGLNPWAISALAVAFLVAVRDMITRFVPSEISTGSMTVLSAIVAGLAGVALAPFETWSTPTPKAIGLSAAAAALTVIGNILIIKAFRIGEASLVAPFRYVVIPFSLVWGYLAFGEKPDAAAIIGIALIVGGGLYTLHRERKLRAAASGETQAAH